MLTYSVGLSGVSGVRIREDAHSVRAIPFFGGEEKLENYSCYANGCLGDNTKHPIPLVLKATWSITWGAIRVCRRC